MRATPSCERSPAGVHLFHPGQVRTGEHVATLDPPRAYWAGCAVCGVTVDLAAPARERAGPGPDGLGARHDAALATSLAGRRAPASAGQP